MKNPSRVFFGACAISLIAFTPVSPLQAAENGVGFYLLGLRGPLAGITPPPGVYFQNDFLLLLRERRRQLRGGEPLHQRRYER